MRFVCLWSPAWPTGAVSGAPAAFPELTTALLAVAPRIAVGEPGTGVMWADARGLPSRALAGELLAILRANGLTSCRAGVAMTPVAAALAARSAAGPITVVAPGDDRASIAPHPIDWLEPPAPLRPLLSGLAIETCGQLAALDADAIEVRFGQEGVALWRLARADDPRLLFSPIPRELPHASLEWLEYQLTDAARLVFVINALLERVCATLTANGQGAREMTLTFSLVRGAAPVHTLQAGRPTADRRVWIRLARTALERFTLASAVSGIALQAGRLTESESRQGDLFDRGLVTAHATEEAVARLAEDQDDVVLVPENSAHPLLDRRTTWVERPALPVRARLPDESLPDESTTGLTLQLLPAPRAIVVESVRQRHHDVPVRYRDAGGWHEIAQADSAERVSGHEWDRQLAYARTYFRCVTGEGELVWLFRDDRHQGRGGWFLHGRWD